jgi:hypothetical protein
MQFERQQKPRGVSQSAAGVRNAVLLIFGDAIVSLSVGVAAMPIDAVDCDFRLDSATRDLALAQSKSAAGNYAL